MSELKTIKDFEDFSKHQTGNRMVEKLREEAIEHIKSKKQNEGFGLTPDTIYWIQEFFNITEDDLK